MKIFRQTTQYALRGVGELASRQSAEPVMLDELIAGTSLPRDFMAKIFQRLVAAGLLRSRKGRGGGFLFARPSRRIKLAAVIEAVEGRKLFEQCSLGIGRCSDKTLCPQHDLYKPIRQRLRDYLCGTTVADLGEAVRTKRQRMQDAAKRRRPGRRAAVG